MLVLAALLAAAAPVTAPAPPGVEVAIVWWEPVEAEEEGDLALRQQLREALAEQLDIPVEAVRDRAFEDARALAPHRQSRELAELHGQLREELDGADLDFRAGRFEAAQARASAVLERLHARPDLPGAAASAREAHLLSAKLAWAAADFERAEQELAAALDLDPRAQLSSREAPPGLIERYAELQTRLLGSESTWTAPELRWGDAGPPERFEIELDGVQGMRTLPPGPHFVRVRVPGHAALARWQDTGQAIELAQLQPLLGPDVTRSSAEICALLGLERLVIAAAREGRLALQVRDCTAAHGAPWFADELGPGALSNGLAQALAGPFDQSDPGLLDAWPPLVDSGPILPPPEEPPPRPWFRKGWIWGTSVGALALVSGAVAAGVLLGGARGPAGLDVDADDFIGAP